MLALGSVRARQEGVIGALAQPACWRPVSAKRPMWTSHVTAICENFISRSALINGAGTARLAVVREVLSCAEMLPTADISDIAKTPRAKPVADYSSIGFGFS